MTSLFSTQQLNAIIHKPLEESTIDIYHFLGVQFEYNFNRDQIYKAKEALAIILKRKFPILEPIPEKQRHKTGELQVSFDEKERDIFWSIYNDRIR